MIVTLAAMAEFETFMPTVLINTVGGRYALSLPGYDHRTQDNLGAIIELEDEFDERARQETNRRLLQYGAHRWPVFTRAGLMIDPATIPSRSRTRRTAYQRRVGCWRADSEGAG
jgi:hypothetical protein